MKFVLAILAAAAVVSAAQPSHPYICGSRGTCCLDEDSNGCTKNGPCPCYANAGPAGNNACVSWYSDSYIEVRSPKIRVAILTVTTSGIWLWPFWTIIASATWSQFCADL